MVNLQFILPIFLWFILVGRTVYSIYVRFGPYSKTLRDPFEEHDD